MSYTPSPHIYVKNVPEKSNNPTTAWFVRTFPNLLQDQSTRANTSQRVLESFPRTEQVTLMLQTPGGPLFWEKHTPKKVYSRWCFHLVNTISGLILNAEMPHSRKGNRGFRTSVTPCFVLFRHTILAHTGDVNPQSLRLN